MGGWHRLQTSSRCPSTVFCRRRRRPEIKAHGQGKPVDRVPIGQLEAKLAASGSELERPAPDAKTVQWNIPASAVADDASDKSNTVVFRLAGHGLEPDLRPGDFVFADVACRTVSTPGIYLLVIACLPAWRRCEPLIGENVLVSHEAGTQEVPSEGFACAGAGRRSPPQVAGRLVLNDRFARLDRHSLPSRTELAAVAMQGTFQAAALDAPASLMKFVLTNTMQQRSRRPTAFCIVRGWHSRLAAGSSFR